MNVRDLIDKLKNIKNQLLGNIRRPVPTGMTEFYALVDKIVETYNPPMSKKDVTFVLAASLQRLDPKENSERSLKSYWVELRRAACTQIGGHVIYMLKQEQEEERKAEQLKLEATANAEASNDKPIQNQTV